MTKNPGKGALPVSEVLANAAGNSAQKTIEPEHMQELFLPVHGHVELLTEEIAVVDHPAFQRLRRVKQLGLAHMVFPGATHTRFEHSIGAVHVAQLIIDHVNENHHKSEANHREWQKIGLDNSTRYFIRLAALLHDVGHLPVGHTLEDELNHLRSHDGPERLRRVADIPYPHYEPGQSIISLSAKPKEGWTLRALITHLYRDHVKLLGLGAEQAFNVLCHIVSKPPKHEGVDKQAWEEEAKTLRNHIPLGVCRDIVGNTICADFLDYLYRDWYHLGKPMYYDMRLYQYMEVRKPLHADGDGQPKFLVNVGASEKIRHDALTDILELLNARYKLAETVLFHRTKLALTGLLDRCLLEIADLYDQVGLGKSKFAENAEALLLDASDDGLPLILNELAAGGDKEGKQVMEAALAQENSTLHAATSSSAQQEMIPPVLRGKLAAQKELALRLVERLRDRDVYPLAFKLRMADFTGPRNPENVCLRRLLEIYKQPVNRLEYLRMTEVLCEFSPGTLIMNCPADAAMNAKIASVNLYIEDDVSPFDKYEQRGQPNLTRGALLAQIDRFYELWAAGVYVDSRTWHGLTEAERKHLKSVLREFLFRMETEKDPNVARAQMQPSLDVLRKKASRAGTVDPREEAYRNSSFPSGMPFDRPLQL
jgi:HD superfamily phosphohydrolase